jgi:hypothetical protein
MGKHFRMLIVKGDETGGIMSTRILKKIIDESGKQTHELFDYIVGISTGSFIAAALTVTDQNGKPKYTIDDVITILEQYSKNIVPRNPWYEWPVAANIYNWLAPSDSNNYDFLDKIFGNATFDKTLLPLTTISYALEKSSPRIWSSFNPLFYNGSSYDYFIKDAVAASVAAQDHLFYLIKYGTKSTIYSPKVTAMPNGKTYQDVDVSVLARSVTALGISELLKSHPELTARDITVLTMDNGRFEDLPSHLIVNQHNSTPWLPIAVLTGLAAVSTASFFAYRNMGNSHRAYDFEPESTPDSLTESVSTILSIEKSLPSPARRSTSDTTQQKTFRDTNQILKDIQTKLEEICQLPAGYDRNFPFPQEDAKLKELANSQAHNIMKLVIEIENNIKHDDTIRLIKGGFDNKAETFLEQSIGSQTAFFSLKDRAYTLIHNTADFVSVLLKHAVVASPVLILLMAAGGLSSFADVAMIAPVMIGSTWAIFDSLKYSIKKTMVQTGGLVAVIAGIDWTFSQISTEEQSLDRQAFDKMIKEAELNDNFEALTLFNSILISPNLEIRLADLHKTTPENIKELNLAIDTYVAEQERVNDFWQDIVDCLTAKSRNNEFCIHARDTVLTGLHDNPAYQKLGGVIEEFINDL